MLPKNPIVRFPLDTKQSCHPDPDPELAKGKGKDLLLHFIVPPLSATNASCQAATAPCPMSDLWTWEPTNLAVKDFATSLPASTPPCIQTEPTTAAFTCAPRRGGSHPRTECHRMAGDGARVLIDTSRWRGPARHSGRCAAHPETPCATTAALWDYAPETTACTSRPCTSQATAPHAFSGRDPACPSPTSPPPPLAVQGG
jgi:hypothetical protein